MIAFGLTEDQLEYQRMARQFIAQHVTPNAGHWDETGHFPRAEIRSAWENGLLNLCIPESVGGAGMPLVDTLIISEEISYGGVGYSTSCMANELALTPVVIGADEAQKQKYIHRHNSSHFCGLVCLFFSVSYHDLSYARSKWNTRWSRSVHSIRRVAQ